MDALKLASTHAAALIGAELGLRLAEVLRAKGLLSDEDIRAVCASAAADLREDHTLASDEAAMVLGEVAPVG